MLEYQRRKTEQRRLMDGPHFVAEDDLPGGAKLHRFDNAGDAPMSAIYYQDIEHFWCPRDGEKEMLEWWGEAWKELIPVMEAESDNGGGN